MVFIKFLLRLPIHYSILENNLNTFRSLLPKTKYSKQQLELLLQFSIQSINDSFIKELISNGIDPNFSTSNGQTILHQAVLERNPNLVYFLLSQGSDPNWEDNSIPSLLMFFSHLWKHTITSFM